MSQARIVVAPQGLVAIGDGGPYLLEPLDLVPQLVAEQLGLSRDREVGGRDDEWLGGTRVRVGHSVVRESLAQEVTVVSAPLREIAGEGDHVGTAVHIPP